jgi:hypothetical protein
MATKFIKVANKKKSMPIKEHAENHASANFERVNNIPYGQDCRYKTNRGNFSVNDWTKKGR